MNEVINALDFNDRHNKGKKKWALNCERHMQEERDKLYGKSFDCISKEAIKSLKRFRDSL